MTSINRVANSELELALQKDRTGIFRDSLLTVFNKERMKINNVLNQGVKPDEYSVLTGLLMSIEEAITIVNKMWSKYQSRK